MSLYFTITGIRTNSQHMHSDNVVARLAYYILPLARLGSILRILGTGYSRSLAWIAIWAMGRTA